MKILNIRIAVFIVLLNVFLISCNGIDSQGVSVQSVSLSETKLSLVKGKKETLIATVLPENAEDKSVMWTSSSFDIVSVNENGTITALSEGTANIMVITNDGGRIAVCEVTVIVENEQESTNSDDSYYVLDNPDVIYYRPTVSESVINDYANNYFSFATNEAGMSDYVNNSASEFLFEGTEIYYKIYNNYSQYSSEYSSLYSLSSSENYSSAATKLTETTGFNFLPLSCENYNETPMIPATGKNRRVYIRLTDYGTKKDYSARIEVDGVSIAGSGNSSSPKRNGLVGDYSFNFGRGESNQRLNRVPVSGDADTKYGDFTTSNVFYVSLYAVGVGRDSNYTTYYSNILHLGTVTIDASSENN